MGLQPGLRGTGRDKLEKYRPWSPDKLEIVFLQIRL